MACQECPVCYEKSVNCTLVCGHRFCKSCVKTWYLKGSDSGCPMCRRKVHYRRMPTRKWREEAFENKLSEIYQESFEELIEDLATFYKTNIRLDEVANLEKTYRAIKNVVTDTDELDYVLNETYDYYSDRRVHLEKRGGYSEFGGYWYPIQKHNGARTRSGTRTRARARNNFQRRY